MALIGHLFLTIRRLLLPAAALAPPAAVYASYKWTPPLVSLPSQDLPPPLSTSAALRAALHYLPSRALSRFYGAASSCELPSPLRAPLYSLWARVFSSDMAAIRYPLAAHLSLQEFFTRPLRKTARPIAAADLVSPADGLVTVIGRVGSDGRLEQIKGSSYSLGAFLTCQPSSCSPGAALYYAVIYLGPGDYHRIHSSSDWLLCDRTHCPGDLFPVNPSLLKHIPALFSLNERVVLTGTWRHGFYSLTAVGAYNVGSIHLNVEPDLQTNVSDHSYGTDASGQPIAHRRRIGPMQIEKGQEIGRFMLGSTVVLVWEAPEQFTFNVIPGQKILMGQNIGSVIDDPPK